jgi:Family of unknown function (DUF6206)
MIEAAELARLDALVDHALETGDGNHLRVLGYGEVTLVLAWPADAPRFACKRLPVFPDGAAAAAYHAVLDDYLARLRARGVDVVETEFRTVPRDGGRVSGYCLQPALDPATVAPALLRATEPAEHHPLFGAIVDAVCAVCDSEVGIDAQLANWTWHDGRLRYFDVTTPMLRDAAGELRLDADLFLTSFPWPLRAPFRRFVLPGVIARYSRPRDVLLDLLANMHKERLAGWIPAATAAVNLRVEPPITQREIDKYYKGDARLWAAVLAVRKADRWWQRKIRRRTYPFLLPEHIER